MSTGPLVPQSIRRAFVRAAASFVVVAALCSACASLPEVSRPQRNPAAVRFEGSEGPLSKAQSAAILAHLKVSSGETSLLDRHVALEQAVVDTPLVIGNRVTLLKDGPATYRAMFDAIGKARDHINLETYIFDDDEVGKKFSDLLIRKQREGVQVSILYDGVVAISTPRAFFDRLEDSGIHTLEFNPQEQERDRSSRPSQIADRRWQSVLCRGH